jgi:hypothetical protein
VVTGLAFVLQWWPLVAAVAVVMVATVIGGSRFGLFTQIYVRLVQPRRGGEVATEPAAPSRFAQLLGASMLFVATALIVAGFTTVGWALTLVVTSFATLAATTRVCVGCRLYDRVAG